MLMLHLRQPKFPTFPNPLSPSQTSAGLAAPAAAAVVMGKGGAIAILLVVLYVVSLQEYGSATYETTCFSMAVTSAVSAELIAVSSLLYARFHWPSPHAVLIQTRLQCIRVRVCEVY